MMCEMSDCAWIFGRKLYLVNKSPWGEDPPTRYAWDVRVRGETDVHNEMILKMFPHAREILDNIDIVLLQLLGVADSR